MCTLIRQLHIATTENRIPHFTRALKFAVVTHITLAVSVAPIDYRKSNAL